VTSPAVLAALVVLLLNDHVLKRAWPGLVTGKLSDVAGPVVAAALLGSFARVVSRRLEAPAWWAVAVAFALCKTVPGVNAAVPLAGVADPWDVLGLAALPFAWRLRDRRLPGPRPGTALRAAAVVVAVVAVTATSQPDELRVERIDASGATVRALGRDEHRGAVLWTSADGGLTWSRSREEPGPLPAPRTSTCSARHCYRIANPYEVEESTDGGGTWALSWWAAYRDEAHAAVDVTFVAGTDTVLVALGRGGVLRRAAPEPWQQLPVGDARPVDP
jgi:hypothetical protein